MKYKLTTVDGDLKSEFGPYEADNPEQVLEQHRDKYPASQDWTDAELLSFIEEVR